MMRYLYVKDGKITQGRERSKIKDKEYIGSQVQLAFKTSKLYGQEKNYLKD